MQQRWRATWYEEGRRREFLFASIKSLMIARIDFRLKFMSTFVGRAAPEQFALTEEVMYYGRTDYQPFSRSKG